MTKVLVWGDNESSLSHSDNLETVLQVKINLKFHYFNLKIDIGLHIWYYIKLIHS